MELLMVPLDLWQSAIFSSDLGRLIRTITQRLNQRLVLTQLQIHLMDQAVQEAVADLELERRTAGVGNYGFDSFVTTSDDSTFAINDAAIAVNSTAPLQAVAEGDSDSAYLDLNFPSTWSHTMWNTYLPRSFLIPGLPSPTLPLLGSSLNSIGDGVTGDFHLSRVDMPISLKVALSQCSTAITSQGGALSAQAWTNNSSIAAATNQRLTQPLTGDYCDLFYGIAKYHEIAGLDSDNGHQWS